jgi:hypothetical protein
VLLLSLLLWRLVEVEETPGGERRLLRERDDYTVNYMNGKVHLRWAAEGNIHIQYFPMQPLRVVSATRLHINATQEIWASVTANESSHLSMITPIAMDAIAANAARLEGLLSAAHNMVDSGLPSLGSHRVLLIFEGLQPLAGCQTEPPKWEIRYRVNATMVLTPAGAAVGIMRYAATGVTWDDRLAALVLASPPPILHDTVTIIQGVDPVTAAMLADLGVTTVG